MSRLLLSEEPYYVPTVRCTSAQMRLWQRAGRILWTRFGYWDTKLEQMIHVDYID